MMNEMTFTQADRNAFNKRRWALMNREKIKAARAAYVANDPEKEALRLKRWREENPAKMKAARIAHKESNPHLAARNESARRASKLNATPSWSGELDDLVMIEAAHLCHLRLVATGIQWHADHMVPLRAKVACGLHCAGNIQVIPASMNTKKQNRMTLTAPGEWLRHL